MLKRMIPFLCVVGLILSITAIPSSAASYGTDMIDSFEYYPNSKILEVEWRPAPSREAVKVTLDETTSAPNRGTGEAKGNYRSMKVEVDRTVEGWDSFRNTTENPYALKELVEANGNGTFNFWAKADRDGVRLYASLDIKDDPFYVNDIVLTTEWKEYKINLRDLKATLHDRKDLDFIEITRQGLWPSGLQEAYLVGFKFGVESPDKATVWLDSISISGDGISEVHEFASADGHKNETTHDREGSKPKNFVASNSSTAKPSTDNSSTAKPSTNSSTAKPSTNSSTAKPSTNSSTAKPSKDSSTTKPSKDNSVAEDVGALDSINSDIDQNAGDSNDAVNTAGGDNNTSGKDDPTKNATSKINSLKIVIIVMIAVVILADSAFVFYLFYLKHKKSSK